MCLLVSSCAGNTSAEYSHSFFAFGTLIEVTLLDTTETRANTAFEHIEHEFHDYHASWTPWEASDLSRINESIQAGSRVSVPQQLLPLIIASKDLFEASNGLFIPAMGNLIDLWQMHRHDESGISPPDAADIGRMVMQNPAMSDIHIDGTSVESHNPDV